MARQAQAVAPVPAAQAASEPRYFATAADWAAWLDAHAATARELLVGFHKVGSGVPSMSWPQSVDEALCHGWIDGVRTRVDELRYSIRFTPRKAHSHWSAVNVARMAELQAQGRVQPAGEAAFALRHHARTAKAAYEQPGEPELDAALLAPLQADATAWAWFQAQAPWWRKQKLWWLAKAVQPATAQRRVAQLLAACQQQQRL